MKFFKKKEDNNFNNYHEVEDELDDLNLEDFEEDDSSDAENINPDDFEFLVYPWTNEYISTLEDRFNPLYVLEQKVVFIYNPKSITSIYSPINPKMLTLEHLRDNFVSLNNKGEFLKNGNKQLSTQMNLFKGNIKEFIDNIAKVQTEANKNNPKKKFNKGRK